MGMFSLFNSAIKDAKSILNDIEYRILRAVWSEYLRLLPPHHETYMSVTPTWFALEAIVTKGGNFNKFDETNIEFLKILLEGPNVYLKVIDTLKSADYTDEDAEKLFDTHTDLNDVIPPEYQEFRTKAVRDVLVDCATYYQQRLQTFINQHGNKIEKALNH